MNTNLPTLGDIQKMTVDTVSELPPELLADFNEQMKTEKSRLDSLRFLLDAAMERKFQDVIGDAYKTKGVNFGVIHVEINETVLTVDHPSRVNWDEKMLADIGKTLDATADYDSSEFIKTKLSVEEKKFTSWPTAIRKMFEPARTVATGKTTYKLKRKEV